MSLDPTIVGVGVVLAVLLFLGERAGRRGG
jgi:hypothetical protein